MIFIRAPVAAGKTTLVRYLTTLYEEDFVEVVFATNEDMWFQHIINASGQKDLPFRSVFEALMSIGQQGKTIVIDEAHLFFSHSNVVALLTKGLQGRKHAPSILLFSASGSAVGADDKYAATTPVEIANRNIWYPPVPNSVKLVEDLREATPPIYLTVDAVNFLITLCGGHRGILMRAMSWVQQCQNNPEQQVAGNENNNVTSWDNRDCTFHVRKTLDESRMARNPSLGWQIGLRKAFKESRAVRVSGNYSEVRNIPKEFGLVLFEGPKLSEEMNDQVSELTISGFLFPERRNVDDDEFVQCDWTDSTVFHGVSNPIMAEYYSDILASCCKRRLLDSKKMPSSAADLLARVLPYMTFTSVIDNPIPKREGGLQSPLSKENLPYEDDYNYAIAAILRSTLKYTVSTPKNPVTGKTDVVLTYDNDRICAFESIMSWQIPDSHGGHAQRFLNPIKTNYADSHHKALLIIGSKKEQVKRRVNGVAESMKDEEGAPEFIGVVAALTHDNYHMYLPGNQEPLFFVCDRVAKCLERDKHGRFTCAQTCAFR